MSTPEQVFAEYLKSNRLSSFFWCLNPVNPRTPALNHSFLLPSHPLHISSPLPTHAPPSTPALPSARLHLLSLLLLSAYLLSNNLPPHSARPPPLFLTPTASPSHLPPYFAPLPSQRPQNSGDTGGLLAADWREGPPDSPPYQKLQLLQQLPATRLSDLLVGRPPFECPPLTPTLDGVPTLYFKCEATSSDAPALCLIAQQERSSGRMDSFMECKEGSGMENLEEMGFTV